MLPELSARQMQWARQVQQGGVSRADCTWRAEKPAVAQWRVRRRRHRRVIRYGTAADCFVDAWLPAAAVPARAAPRPTAAPVAVLVHGGYWRDRYDCSLMHPLAADLAERGWLAWNIEYRRVGGGGGWPATFDDVRGAVLALDRAPVPIDHRRIVAIGHSAGGHLALWLAAGATGAAGAAGARITAVIAQAPVSDLHRSYADHASDDAVVGLLGGTPSEVPERYDVASPRRRLPLGVPQIVVHGTTDSAVPYDMSVEYVAAARAAGDDVDLAALTGADHFAVIDPTHEAWRLQLDWLSSL